MDKINELIRELQRLRRAKSDNQNKIDELKKENEDINNEKENIKNRIKELGNIYIKIKEYSKHKIKNKIFKLITSKVCFRSLLVILGLVGIGIGLVYGIGAFLLFIPPGVLMAGICYFAYILFYLTNDRYKNINFLKEHNLEETQKELEEKKKQMVLYKKITAINEQKLVELEKEQNNVDLNIEKVFAELSKYEEVKNEVISEILNNPRMIQEIVNNLDNQEKTELIDTKGFQKVIRPNSD